MTMRKIKFRGKRLSTREWVGSGIVTRCLTPTYDGMMNTNRYAFPVSEKIGNIHDNPELLEEEK